MPRTTHRAAQPERITVELLRSPAPVTRPAMEAKTVEMPSWAVPEAVTVSPMTRAVGPQATRPVMAATATRWPAIPDRTAWPKDRQERRSTRSSRTASGTMKVTRPSMVCRGKTRMRRSTTARAFWTSSVTPVVVSWA